MANDVISVAGGCVLRVVEEGGEGTEKLVVRNRVPDQRDACVVDKAVWRAQNSTYSSKFFIGK